MHAAMSQVLREEIERFRLAFCCEDCLHDTGGGCDLLFPSAPHRRATVESLPDGAPLTFCKMFEAEG